MFGVIYLREINLYWEDLQQKKSWVSKWFKIISRVDNSR